MGSNDRRLSVPQVLIAVAVAGALAVGLLSMATVAWGARGVVLTCVLVTVIGAGVAADAYRRR